MSEKSKTHNAASRYDHTIGRIPVKRLGKGGDLGGNRGGNRKDSNGARMRGGGEPFAERHIELETAPFDQCGHFPQADVRKERPLVRRKPIERGDRGCAESTILIDPPDPRMGIEQ